MNATNVLFGILGVVFIGAFAFTLINSTRQFSLPQGTTTHAERTMQHTTDTTGSEDALGAASSRGQSNRELLVTDGVVHSIPLDEILSGGPPKDGIPSIDDPQFISAASAEKQGEVSDSSVGIGLVVNGDARFYPYTILVWHEIVNDTVGGEPVLVTYCPLCATGIVFDRRVNGDAQEFGVSGRLWKSNLLMYNRAKKTEDESLWSQVLGEAVLGVDTGSRLDIVRSDIAQWGTWKRAHPETVVLSQDTGALRTYGTDPYGDYYTSESVSFGATFNDQRLHPKTFVLGVEINGVFKAYDRESLTAGEVSDTFAGKDIRITKTADGEIRMTADGAPIPYVGGFWFSWLAVHPDTELYKK